MAGRKRTDRREAPSDIEVGIATIISVSANWYAEGRSRASVTYRTADGKQHTFSWDLSDEFCEKLKLLVSGVIHHARFD